MKKLVSLLIILLFFLFLLQLYFGGEITGNLVAKQYEHLSNFECNKEIASSNLLSHTHDEVDYNSMRLCCEQLGGYWFDVTNKQIRCSSWYYCSGRYDPKQPWAHCVFL